MTLAQELGLTAAEAHAIARQACDLANAGHLEAARRLLEGLTHLDPDHASAWATLGALAWRQGLIEDAERSLRRALSLEHGHPGALETLRAMGRSGAHHQRLRTVPEATR